MKTPEIKSYIRFKLPKGTDYNIDEVSQATERDYFTEVAYKKESDGKKAFHQATKNFQHQIAHDLGESLPWLISLDPRSYDCEVVKSCSSKEGGKKER